MLGEGSLRHVRRHWAVFAGLVVALGIWCAVDVSRRAIVDPVQPWLHMTDFSVYTEAGAAFFDGRPPYEVQNIRGWKYVYPPLFALIVSPLSHLDSPMQAAVWFAISVLLSFGIYFECRRLLATLLNNNQRAATIAWQLGLVAGITVLFPLLNCLQRGQVGVALLYPMLVGFRWLICGNGTGAWFSAGIVLALPIVLKLTPVLPVGCLGLAVIAACWKKWRTATAEEQFRTQSNSVAEPDLVREFYPAVVETWRGPIWLGGGIVAGMALFALFIPAAFVGWNANLRHLETWYDRVVTKANHDRTDQFAENGNTVRNQSLKNAVNRFGNWVGYLAGKGPDDRIIETTIPEMGTMPMDHWLVDPALLVARAAAGLLLLAAVIGLGRRGDALSLGYAWGLACVATLVVSPVARGHYFILYLPAMLFGGSWMLSHQTQKRAAAMNLTPLVLCVGHYLALNVLGRIGLLGIGTTLWFASSCVLVLAIDHRSAKAAAAVDDTVEIDRRLAA